MRPLNQYHSKINDLHLFGRDFTKFIIYDILFSKSGICEDIWYEVETFDMKLKHELLLNINRH